MAENHAGAAKPVNPAPESASSPGSAETAEPRNEPTAQPGAYDPRIKRGPLAPQAIVLPTPPLQAKRGVPPAGLRMPRYRLVQRSVSRNEITDEARWFAQNGLSMPEQRAQTMTVDPPRARFDEVPLDRVLGQEIWIYRAGHDAPALIVGRPETRGLEVAFAFDFRHFEWPYPEATPKGAPYPKDSLIRMRSGWAELRGQVLYVAHGHNTYAETSHGRNAYLSAIDTRDGELIWRSEPLVSNAHTFLIIDDVVITGYGFTAEPDYLFLLDRHTGKILGKTKVKSGPEYILLKEDRIHVRTYDHDYVFELRATR